MLYQLYQAQADLLYPARQMARIGASLARAFDVGELTPNLVRQWGAACDVFAGLELTHKRPSYNLPTTTMGNSVVAVTEESVFETPFGTLLRFKKDTDAVQPR